MKKLISYIVVILLIVGAYFLGKNNTYSPPSINNYKLDSIKKEYKKHLDKYIETNDSLEHIVDSLNSAKDSIEIRYEVIYKDYGNPNIVSDDSVMRYIAKKIRNI